MGIVGLNFEYWRRVGTAAVTNLFAGLFAVSLLFSLPAMAQPRVAKATTSSSVAAASGYPDRLFPAFDNTKRTLSSHARALKGEEPQKQQATHLAWHNKTHRAKLLRQKRAKKRRAEKRRLAKQRKIRRAKLRRQKRAQRRRAEKRRLARQREIRRAKLQRQKRHHVAKRHVRKQAKRSNEASTTLKRAIVRYNSEHPPGTIIINNKERRLYYTLGGGQAIRYAVAVGRLNAQWRGRATVIDKKKNPTWRPTANIRRDNPELPAVVRPGPRNPLGVRAIYLNRDLYRIHGTNAPRSIGRAVSYGCIRMYNHDVIDLYARVNKGTRVVVQ